MKPRTSRGQRTLSAAHFTSPENWQLEQERIFRRSWLLAGHVSDLPAPGSYFLFEAGGDSVIILRDRAGVVRAHHNFCRHRGTRLCETARGELGATLAAPTTPGPTSSTAACEPHPTCRTSRASSARTGR